MTDAEAVSTPGSRPSKPDYRSELALRVDNRVSQLQETYLQDVASTVSTLAHLRQAAGKAPGEDPSAWAETLSLVDDLGIDTSEPTAREWAVHLSMTLFAIHQQSQRDRRMHKVGRSLGRASRDLAEAKGGEEASDAVLRRFHMLGTAATLPEVAHHARSLISQFRAEDIPLDYGLLTDHLIKLQDPRTAPAVRLAWGRDYYRTRRTAAETTSQGDIE